MGRHATRNTTEYHRSLDIREMKREGWLEPRGWRTIRWRRGGEVTASIGVLAMPDRLYLRYTHESWQGERQDHEYPVFFDSTRCNYGGERLWFICPARGCSRRVAVLYSDSIFACRQCLDLSYESQREPPWGRAFRKAQRIHEKLGGTGFTGDEFPEKPKWMHWKSYSRLVQQYECAESLSWPPFLLKNLGTAAGTPIRRTYPE